MICKYCGKETDNNTEICSVCRDMLGVDEPEVQESFEAPEESAPQVEAEVFTPPSKLKKARKEKAKKEPKEPGRGIEKPELIPMLALIMCALCLIVAVFSVYSSAKMRSEMAEAVNFANKTQAEKIAGLEGRVAELEAQIAAEAEAEKAQAEAEARNFKIISTPSNESRELGNVSQPGYYLFGFSVEGPLESFKWEKKLPDGSYVPVEFDENGKCAAFGISKIESITEGYSRLAADGLTINAAGTYKCTAISSFGDKLEASVVLEITQ